MQKAKITRTPRPLPPEEAASLLKLFDAAPPEALLPQEAIAAVLGVPVATLEKARCIGQEEFPKFVKLGARVRYRKSDVLAHLAALETRSVA